MSNNKQKIRVFARVSYSVFDMPGFFTQFHKFIGEFQLEQTIEESINNQFRIWFWTDEVEINEGQSRQVSIEATANKGAFNIAFKISKY